MWASLESFRKKLTYFGGLSHPFGRRDQEKMDEYLTSVRGVEKRVERAQDWLDVQKPEVDPASVNVEASPEDAKEYIRAKYVATTP